MRPTPQRPSRIPKPSGAGTPQRPNISSFAFDQYQVEAPGQVVSRLASTQPNIQPHIPSRMTPAPRPQANPSQPSLGPGSARALHVSSGNRFLASQRRSTTVRG